MKAVTNESTAWSLPNFRRLWTATASSSFGSEVSEIALPLLAITTLSASAVEVGWVRTAQFLPFLLMTLPLGVLVDRWRRRRLTLLVGADLGRFVLFVVIPLLVWAGLSDVRPLYLVVFGIGALTVLYQLADFAFLPSVVDEARLIDANGKISATVSANEIAGRGLGGLLVQAVTAPVAVLVNGVAFGVSALCLRRIDVDQLRGSDDDAGARDHPIAIRDAATGVRYALRDRYIRALLGEATTYNLCNEIFLIGLMLWTVRDLGLGAAIVGLVFTAGGLGSFLGAWFGSRMTRRFGYGRVLLISMTVGNTAPLGTVLIDGPDAFVLPVLCGVFALIGIGTGIANVHAVTLRQTTVSEALRGQVNAAYRLVSWGAVPIGAAVGGLVAQRFGAQSAVFVGAAGIAAATLWVALSPVRRLRSIEDARR